MRRSSEIRVSASAAGAAAEVVPPAAMDFAAAPVSAPPCEPSGAGQAVAFPRCFAFERDEAQAARSKAGSHHLRRQHVKRGSPQPLRADRKMQGPGFRLADQVPGNGPAKRPVAKICL